jgi:hypothetical protein
MSGMLATDISALLIRPINGPICTYAWQAHHSQSNTVWIVPARRQVSLSMLIATNGDVFPPLDSSPLRQPSARPFSEAHDGPRGNASVLPVESRLCRCYRWYGIATRMTHTVENVPKSRISGFG